MLAPEFRKGFRPPRGVVWRAVVRETGPSNYPYSLPLYKIIILYYVLEKAFSQI